MPYILAQADSVRTAQTEAFLKAWINADAGISRTPKFASWVTPNGALPVVANAGMLAWIYHKNSGSSNAKYVCWGEFQMRYMLGDGHAGMVVGADNYPKQPAHKGASCAGKPPLLLLLPLTMDRLPFSTCSWLGGCWLSSACCTATGCLGHSQAEAVCSLGCIGWLVCPPHERTPFARHQAACQLSLLPAKPCLISVKFMKSSCTAP